MGKVSEDNFDSLGIYKLFIMIGITIIANIGIIHYYGCELSHIVPRQCPPFTETITFGSYIDYQCDHHVINLGCLGDMLALYPTLGVNLPPFPLYASPCGWLGTPSGTVYAGWCPLPFTCPS